MAESEPDFSYKCSNPDDVLCAETCVGLEDCQDCSCAVAPTDGGGPWGEVMDVIFCLLPIVFLLVATIKRNPLPTTHSLPLAALFMLLVRLMYLGSDPLLTAGSVVLGLHEALTPLSIMAGAITLFESMEATKCMPYMMREMKALTAGHPIAELMLIFCFAYMVEGASGFGTPVALGAPMLVSTGHSPMESVVVLLVMNTFATVWGAVGTPIWFGFAGLTDEDGFVEVSYQAGVALGIASFLLMPLALTIVVPWALVKQNLVFVFCSLATVIGPALGISFGSFEFPSLMGGLIGCAGTALLIRLKVGLSEIGTEHFDEQRHPMDFGSVSDHSVVRKFHKSSSNVSDITTASETPQDDGVGAQMILDQIPEEVSKEQIDGDVTHDASERRPPKDNSDKLVANGGDQKDTHLDAAEMTRSDVAGQVDATAMTKSNVVVDSTPLRETIDDHLGPRKEFGADYVRELIMRTFPIWAVVLLLILTRVEQIGIKEYLTKPEPNFSIHFGTYGNFRLSASVVFQLQDILTYPGLKWKYELLYIPFLVPFVLVSALTLIVFRKDLTHGPGLIVQTVAKRLKAPAIALMGALVLVQLLIKADSAAPSFILGNILADWFQEAFIIISPLLGALGSFFSGSTTVSNLSFGNIQVIAAESIGTSITTMLALQAVGASAGNGICLNNIIAACAVVGLNVGEGKILVQTYKFVLANTTIATIVMLAFFFRFN